MTYATQQDLVDRFGQQEMIELTDRNNTGSIDPDPVTRALNDADAEINGYLAGNYALPLKSTPVLLVRIAADVTRYYLYDDKATEQVTNRYNDAVTQLQAIRDGTLSLGLDQANAETAAAGSVAIQANDRVFTNNTLSDYSS